MSSRKVKIKRRTINSTLPDQFLMDATKKIGGSLTKSGSILKGIDFEEEKKFLPRILGLPYSHVDFMTQSNNWYNKMNIPVPELGIELEVGVKEDLSDEKVPFEPINLENWLKYKYAISHREVASSKQDVYSDPNYVYYIEDTDKEVMNTNSNVKEKQAAYKEFIKISEDETKVDLVLRVLAPKNDERISSFKSLSPKEKENKLSTYLEKNPKLFFEVCIDKDLELKAEIESMVDSMVITKVGNSFIYGSEPLGDDIEQVIAKLKAPSQSELYTILKAKLEAFGAGIKVKDQKTEQRAVKK